MSWVIVGIEPRLLLETINGELLRGRVLWLNLNLGATCSVNRAGAGRGVISRFHFFREV